MNEINWFIHPAFLKVGLCAGVARTTIIKHHSGIHHTKLNVYINIIYIYNYYANKLRISITRTGVYQK
jgi:hypothetical protein